MSVQAMSWVIEHSTRKGADLLCLLMIANHAHADGSNSFPSLDVLAKECRMSQRQIARIVARLEESGSITVDRRGGGRGRSNTYRVIMDSAVKGDKMSENTAANSDIITSENRPKKSDKMSEKKPETLTYSTRNSDIAMAKEPFNRLTTTSATPTPSPFEAVEAMCEALGTDPHVMDNKTLGRQCKRAAAIVNDYSLDEIKAFTRFMLTEEWRTSPVDMFAVARGIGSWRLNGSRKRAGPSKQSKDEPSFVSQTFRIAREKGQI